MLERGVTRKEEGSEEVVGGPEEESLREGGEEGVEWLGGGTVKN